MGFVAFGGSSVRGLKHMGVAARWDYSKNKKIFYFYLFLLHLKRQQNMRFAINPYPHGFKMSPFLYGGREGWILPPYGNHKRWTAILTKLCIMQGSDVKNMCCVFLFQKKLDL